MIEYEYTEGGRGVPVRVRVDKRISGEIRPVDGGWQYFPKGQKTGGEVFKTMDECQKSLSET